MFNHNNPHGVRTCLHLVLMGFVLAAGTLASAQAGTSPSAKPPAKVTPGDLVGKKVRKIVAEQLGVDPKRVVRKALLREDLGADALSMLDLSDALQQAFDIAIHKDDMKTLLTVQDTVDFVSKRVKAAK
jgi:acyl carrier protein